MSSELIQHANEVMDSGDKRYNITEIIGEGGFAWVFKARDRREGKDVAVKIGKSSYDSELNKLFDKEGFLLENPHPNLVEVYDIMNLSGFPVMVMELAESNLQVHNLRRVFDLEGVCEVMNPICSAADFLHSQGKTHRDLKPSNILVCKGVYKIADLGSAGATGTTSSAHGTDSYRAIESFWAEGKNPEFFKESDVYSLGVITYFLLTKKTPFSVKFKSEKKDENFMRDMCKKIGAEERLTETIVRATHPDYHKRFHSAGELYSAIKSLT
ncbi:MAG: serine/threonine-protein kinase [archaeon]